jgi:hypothetical protein
MVGSIGCGFNGAAQCFAGGGLVSHWFCDLVKQLEGPMKKVYANVS